MSPPGPRSFSCTGPARCVVLQASASHSSRAVDAPLGTVELPSIGAVATGPTVGLERDAAAVQAAIDEVGRARATVRPTPTAARPTAPASYRQPRVSKGSVYLCAFVPESGESLVAIGAQLAPWIRLLEGGLTLPDPEQAADLFDADCDAATQAWAIGNLRPQCGGPPDVVAHPGWRTSHRLYLLVRRSADAPLERDLSGAGSTRSWKSMPSFPIPPEPGGTRPDPPAMELATSAAKPLAASLATAPRRTHSGNPRGPAESRRRIFPLPDSRGHPRSNRPLATIQLPITQRSSSTAAVAQLPAPRPMPREQRWLRPVPQTRRAATRTIVARRHSASHASNPALRRARS